MCAFFWLPIYAILKLLSVSSKTKLLMLTEGEKVQLVYQERNISLLVFFTLKQADKL